MRWNATKIYVMTLLERQRGDRAKTARLLGMGVRSLNLKLRRWGVADKSLNDKDSQDV
jgi:DNA-binding NtrC family response regulator